MKIFFALQWANPRQSLNRAFKSKAAYELVREYERRIQAYCRCELAAAPPPEKRPGRILWICERSRPATPVDSETLTEKLEEIMMGAGKELWIVIGGPDGMTRTEIRKWSPDFLWSFGPMTLPHEIASVVASEQIYRAWTIHAGHPYHQGH